MAQTYSISQTQRMRNNMKKYISPMVELTKFDCEDMVMTSGLNLSQTSVQVKGTMSTFSLTEALSQTNLFED